MKDLIADSMKEKGFILLKSSNEEDYFNIISSLGETLYQTEVKMQAGKSNVVYNPQEILFHTDYPKADFVSWFCVNSGNREAPLELIDTVNIRKMDADTLETLRGIKVGFKCKIDREIYEAPLILDYKFGIGTTYNPWGLQSEMTDEQKSCYDKLLKIFEDAERLVIDIDQGDILIIDNRRMLHGRREIAENSPRHLTRVFIKDVNSNIPLEYSSTDNRQSVYE